MESAVTIRTGSSGETCHCSLTIAPSGGATGPSNSFSEHTGIEPVLVPYENFAADYETSTLQLLERLDLTCPDDFKPMLALL